MLSVSISSVICRQPKINQIGQKPSWALRNLSSPCSWESGQSPFQPQSFHMLPPLPLCSSAGVCAQPHAERAFTPGGSLWALEGKSL